MKNVMKKLFSLLLVGVVAVSMFGFIAPNNVDAAEAEPSKGTVYFHHRGLYTGRYIASFYDASGELICSYNTGYVFPGQSSRCTIPEETKTITVETQKEEPSDWFMVKIFKFDLDESKSPKGGTVSVIGKGRTLDSAESVSYCDGCWKYAGTIER